ncbi:rod shape-determining protein MreD [Dysgonomonadaceae bacterium zrk40]|nr:rod shape-determining protein MreD [Dysgonomonadaceae bacterium zrk40]
MKISYIRELLLFLMLVLLQVLLLSRINLFGMATPVIYGYFLLKLPVGRNQFYVIISAFLMGLIIDIFLNTLGMNAAAITLVAMFRKSLMGLFFEKDEFEGFVPGMNSAPAPFVRFTIFTIFIHVTLLFFIESFTLFNLVNTLLRIIISGVSSILLIIAIDKLIYRRKNSEQS